MRPEILLFSIFLLNEPKMLNILESFNEILFGFALLCISRLTLSTMEFLKNIFILLDIMFTSFQKYAVIMECHGTSVACI